MGPRIEAMIRATPARRSSAAYLQFETAAEERERSCPRCGSSILPIVLPIVLIFLNTISRDIVEARRSRDWRQRLVQIVAFVGNPVIARGLGVSGRRLRSDAAPSAQRGQLEQWRRVSRPPASSCWSPAPAARSARCYATAGPASPSAHWVGGLAAPGHPDPVRDLLAGAPDPGLRHRRNDHRRLDLGADPDAGCPTSTWCFAAQAAAIGSMVFGYFNDSYFWVVNRMLGVKNAKHQMLVWSIPTTICLGHHPGHPADRQRDLLGRPREEPAPREAARIRCAPRAA